MIVSRVAERARLDALLTALVRGEGGALVVHGEAGIGKTTLLEALVERCDGAVTVVRACGAETEAELAFSALTDLPRMPNRKLVNAINTHKAGRPGSAIAKMAAFQLSTSNT